MGCGAVVDKKPNDAPFLRQYFDATAEVHKMLMEQMTSEKNHPSELEELETNIVKLLKKMDESLRKSFKLHDYKNTGVLDKQEAKHFFNNFVAAHRDFATCMAQMALNQTLIALLKQEREVAGLKGQEYFDKRRELRNEFKEKLTKAEHEIKIQASTYYANKAQRDVDAFRSIDINGDGTLVLEEFVKAVKPDTAENLAFLKALGVDPHRDDFALQISK